MPRGHQLLGGARIFAAVCLLALAGASAGWIVRDAAAGAAWEEQWREGPDAPFTEFVRPVSSGLDVVLVLVHLAGAAAVLRRGAGAGIPAVLGAVTVALHVSGLWGMDLHLVRGGDGGLFTAVLTTAIGQLVLGAALVVTAVAGRDTDGPPPAAVPRARGVTAGLALLAALAGLVATRAPEVRFLGWDAFWERAAGDTTPFAVLSPPTGWTWTVTVLCALVGALAALCRAGFARPLGLVTGALLLGQGAWWVVLVVRAGLPEHVGDLHPTEVTQWAGWAGVLLAGAVTLLTLAPRVRVARDEPYATAPAASGPPPPAW